MVQSFACISSFCIEKYVDGAPLSEMSAAVASGALLPKPTVPRTPQPERRYCTWTVEQQHRQVQGLRHASSSSGSGSYSKDSSDHAGRQVQQTQPSAHEYSLRQASACISLSLNGNLDSEGQHGVWFQSAAQPGTLSAQPRGALDEVETFANGLHTSMTASALTTAFLQLLQHHGAKHKDASFLEDNRRGPAAGQQSHEQHIKQLLHHASVLMAQMQPKQASLVLYVCAKCKLPCQQQLLSGLLMQLQPHQLQQLPPAAMVNTLWALAVLQLSPDAAWLNEFYTASMQTKHSATQGASGTVRPPAAADDSSSSSATDDLFAAFNKHQQVQLVWAAGSLKQKPPGPWLQGLLSAVQPHLQALSSTEVTNLIWGLAQLGFRPGQAWLSAWFKAARHNLPVMSPESLASMTTSLALLRIRVRGAWWEVGLRAAVTQKLYSMQPHHIACVLSGLAKTRMVQPPHWVRMVLVHQLQMFGCLVSTSGNNRQGTSSSSSSTGSSSTSSVYKACPRDVAATVWALPFLLHPTAVDWASRQDNAALLKHLVALSLPLLPDCSAGELVQLVVGFSRLRVYPGVHWLKTHENTVAQHKLALTDANRWRLQASVSRLWGDR